MNLQTTNLIRWSGLAAIGAGLIFAGIQPVHPPDQIASVTTGTWATVITLKLAMCLLFLIAVTGLYARQVEASGILGLAGMLLLVISWFLQTGFVFAELLILPTLASSSPGYVESFLGIFNGVPGSMDIGPITAIYGVVGLFYLLGGIVFGIAMVRSAVLPRWPAILLAVAALATPAAALLPHAAQRYAAVPMGVAFIWLGYTLWTEKRNTTASSNAPPSVGPLRPAGAH